MTDTYEDEDEMTDEEFCQIYEESLDHIHEFLGAKIKVFVQEVRAELEEYGLDYQDIFDPSDYMANWFAS